MATSNNSVSGARKVIAAITCTVIMSACNGPPDINDDLVANPLPDVSPAPVAVSRAKTVAYRGATLIDGTGAEPVRDATVLVRGPEILAAGSDVVIPADAEVVTVNGKWIVPGLIDAHVHFMVSGRIYTRPSFIDLTHVVPYDEEVRWMTSRLPATLTSLLCSGVTSVMSAGGPRIEFTARALASRRADAPTVFLAHGPISLVPRFMAKAFFPLFDGEVAIKSARTGEEGAALVRQGAAMDVDLIKTVYDTGGSKLREWLQNNYEDVHKGIIRESGKYGFKVTSHAHELEPARRLIELGISSIQHIPVDAPLDKAFVELAKEKGVIVVPTLSLRKRTFSDVYTRDYQWLPVEETCGDPEVIESLYAVDSIPLIGDERVQELANSLTLAGQNTLTLYEAGVDLAVGTDAGNFGMLHGPSLHLELLHMSKAGIPNADLIVASTLNSARVVGREGEYGSLEAGKYADFLILDADPLDNIANLQIIDTIVKYGQPFKQSALLPSHHAL